MSVTEHLKFKCRSDGREIVGIAVAPMFLLYMYQYVHALLAALLP
jgi:hypothetical protein